MLAAVDVGTNTVRLLIGRTRGGKVEPVRYYRRITRLGGSFSQEKGLAPDAAERTLSALKEIAQLTASFGVHRIRAVGTAVLRMADNGAAFLETVRHQTGLALEVIGGEEEATLSAVGVRSALDPVPPRCMIMDIGGGSTELVLCEGEKVLFSRSYPLGVVSLCEQYGDAAGQGERIDDILARFQADLVFAGVLPLAFAADCPLIGTAGTVTTLAALKLKMTEYDWRRVNSLVLHRSEMVSMLYAMDSLAPEEREALPGMEKGRGDLIIPGLRIVLHVLEILGKQELIVSDFGLLEGVLLTLGDEGND